MIKVSVIVPVYNVASYLLRCLDSISRQTLNEIEIIAVDDGSTDGSEKILDDYAMREPRLKVIHQANAGAGAARNAGMDAAAGEYLYFADADDFIARRMLERMSVRADRTSAEIVACCRTLYDADGVHIVRRQGLRANLWLKRQPFSAIDIAEDLFSFSKNVAWDKLFRRDFILRLGLRFQNLPRSNDVLFVNLALASSSRIALVWGAWVCHRQGRPDGLQATKDKSPDCLFQAYDALRKRLEDIGRFDAFKLSYAETLLGSGLYNLATLHERANALKVYRDLRVRMEGLSVDFGHTRRFAQARQWQKDLLESGGPDGLPSPSESIPRGLRRLVNALPFTLREGMKIMREFSWRVWVRKDVS